MSLLNRQTERKWSATIAGRLIRNSLIADIPATRVRNEASRSCTIERFRSRRAANSFAQMGPARFESVPRYIRERRHPAAELELGSLRLFWTGHSQLRSLLVAGLNCGATGTDPQSSGSGCRCRQASTHRSQDTVIPNRITEVQTPRCPVTQC